MQTIALTFREIDGKIHKTSLSPENLSIFVNNIRFVNKNVANFIYHFNQWNISNAHHLTTPTENGLVIIDLKNNLIISSQDIIKLGELSCQSVFSSLDKDGLMPIMEKDSVNIYNNKISHVDLLDCYRLREFYDAKRIRGVKVWKNGQNKLLPLNNTAFESILVWSTKHHSELVEEEGLDSISYVLDMSPFTISYLKVEQRNKLYQKIVDLRIELNDEEISVWEKLLDTH